MPQHRSVNYAGQIHGAPLAADGSHNQVLPINRRRQPYKETLESLMSSVVRSEDHELDEILTVLDALSNMIKSGEFDAHAAEDAIQRTALWAVKKSLLDREVKSLAITDDLTGFYNRRGFLAAAAQQLKLAYRDRQNVLLLFCDVDNLKGINDSFGHREGDLALIRTADALEETFRNSDALSRLGGDEFAVLAWEASIPDIEAILARMARSLEKANGDEFRYHLSVSVGVARYDPQSPTSLGDLMAAADRAMYKHKSRHGFSPRQRHSRRNRNK